ncbi:hypothetical protein FKP32DRAFT_1122765 [Trametes sanguinea]|nr:hypothetical protein FKP32DRAFT_1122765 [Trametes sanguinea]
MSSEECDGEWNGHTVRAVTHSNLRHASIALVRFIGDFPSSEEARVRSRTTGFSLSTRTSLSLIFGAYNGVPGDLYAGVDPVVEYVTPVGASDIRVIHLDILPDTQTRSRSCMRWQRSDLRRGRDERPRYDGSGRGAVMREERTGGTSAPSWEEMKGGDWRKAGWLPDMG